MRKIISTEKAPQPIGAYSQAVIAENIVFLSGQIGIDPNTNKMVKGGIEQETIQALENIKAILASSHLEFTNIVKTTIFVTDIKKMKQVNDIYQSYFDSNFPAREAIEVSKLPMNAKVEISVIAQF